MDEWLISLSKRIVPPAPAGCCSAAAQKNAKEVEDAVPGAEKPSAVRS
jgi:hypothetical protein